MKNEASETAKFTVLIQPEPGPEPGTGVRSPKVVPFEIEMRSSTPERRERPRKFGRAHVWCDWADDMSTDAVHMAAVVAGSLPDGPACIYTKRGEFPILDKAWDAHNREIVRRKSVVFREGLKALLKEHHSAVTFKFSRTAGCSCGCSPGFIVKGVNGLITFYVNQIKPVDPKPKVIEDSSTACPTL